MTTSSHHKNRISSFPKEFYSLSIADLAWLLPDLIPPSAVVWLLFGRIYKTDWADMSLVHQAIADPLTKILGIIIV